MERGVVLNIYTIDQLFRTIWELNRLRKIITRILKLTK